MRTKPATPELAEIRRLHDVIIEIRREHRERLEKGRHYLMSIDTDKITVQDALIAFGWTKEGLEHD